MKSTIVAFALFATTFGTPVRRQAGNLQTFTGALGGITATPVEDSGNPDRPFQVMGDTFVNIGAALARSCDQQFNACANAVNGGDETLNQCDTSSQAGAAAAQGDAQAGGASNANNGDNANAGGNNAADNVNAGGNNAGAGNAASCT